MRSYYVQVEQTGISIYKDLIHNTLIWQSVQNCLAQREEVVDFEPMDPERPSTSNMLKQLSCHPQLPAHWVFFPYLQLKHFPLFNSHP